MIKMALVISECETAAPPTTPTPTPCESNLTRH